MQREMQTDSEHQQDDAQLSELGRQLLVRNEARREGANHYSGKEVANQRAYSEPLSDSAEHEGQSKPGDNGLDKRRFVQHSVIPHATFYLVRSRMRRDQMRRARILERHE